MRTIRSNTPRPTLAEMRAEQREKIARRKAETDAARRQAAAEKPEAFKDKDER